MLRIKYFRGLHLTNFLNQTQKPMRKIYRNWGVFLISLFMLASGPLYGQSVTVSGTIIDDAGQPLPGVSVVEKGTANGATTDIDGKYNLQVAGESSTLVFSFIGFQT